MAETHTLLGMSGALRAGSLNTALIREAARLYAPGQFLEGNLRLPLYDGDLEAEQGVPPEVQALADQIARADAVIIATPEYNKGIPGVLKNALDWISRTKGAPLAGKPVAIMSAAAGRSGGERAQYALRLCLVPLGARVLTGPEVMIGQAASQFDPAGRLSDETSQTLLTKLMAALRDEAERG